MDLVLSRLYEDRRKAKRSQPPFFLGIVGTRRKDAQTVASQDSVASLDSGQGRSIPASQRLPRIQRGGRDMEGAQTAREMRKGAHFDRSFDTSEPSPRTVRGGFLRRGGGHGREEKPSIRDQMGERSGKLPSAHHPGELAMHYTNKDSQPERQYYTLKIRPEEIIYCKEDGEDDPGLQVALSVDGMTCTTKVVKRAPHNDPDRVPLLRESFIFQPEGSPVGTLLMIKLMGHRPRIEPMELGAALVDVSTIPVGGHPTTVVSPLTDETGRVMQVTLSVKIYLRRKSFTFSYLAVEPVFRRNGYAVTSEGLQSFPVPYKKKGMPSGVSFFSLKYIRKVHEDVGGYEVWRAADRLGNQYTVKKFLIMETAYRVFFCSELDGMIDCDTGLGVELCDAFLDGVRLSIVIADLGGAYLREGLAEKGAAPEMVTSIVMRQLLQAMSYMHETKSRLHNDIDARNVLVLRSGEVRLGGFGYSLKHVGKRSKFAGPYVHMSPERLLGLECSFPSDVWSLGMLALEMAQGKCWYDMGKFEGLHALFEFKRMVVSEPSPSLKGMAGVSDELRNFVDKCLQKNIRLRQTPSELLEHPFIQRYEAFMLPAGTWLTKRSKEEAASKLNFTYGGRTINSQGAHSPLKDHLHVHVHDATGQGAGSPSKTQRKVSQEEGSSPPKTQRRLSQEDGGPSPLKTQRRKSQEDNSSPGKTQQRRQSREEPVAHFLED